MLQALKRRFYFVFAYYFRFWASIKLKKWSPKVIVVTGSAGKTTLLHLIEAQLGREAHYSHHANSAYGIPYDILGLQGIHTSKFEWLTLFVKAPFAAFSKPYNNKIYIAEADADRPNEAKFLGKLLKPSATLWISSLHTHTEKYDYVVANGKFASQEEAVAYEYGNLLAATSDLVVINGDSELMVRQLDRTNADVKQVWLNQLKAYEPTRKYTKFVLEGVEYHVPALLPKMNFYQIAMTHILLEYLGKKPDKSYTGFSLPPGRSSVFDGIKDTTLIDSSYNNSNIHSLMGIIEMFESYKAAKKWLVIGDMLEQGKNEEREHKKIADMLNRTHFDHLVLMGRRINKYAKPRLTKELKQRTDVISLDNPNQVKQYLEESLTGGETILFKGAGYLELAIEPLLLRKDEARLLARREPMWRKKFKKLGLT